MTTVSPATDLPAVTSDVLATIVELAKRSNRPDLAHRMAGARERISRPYTLIAVVGEFKQGKSSIINSLVGEPICPVDDDIATAAVTLLRNGEPVVTAWRDSPESATPQVFPLEMVPRLVTEQQDSAGGRIALVDVQLPNGFLANGVALADTPGVGGLSPGYTGLTLAYLQAVDAVLFVTDASSPLTSSELSFLERARQACPAVIVVLSKCDLFPDWRRVLEIDRRSITNAGMDAAIVAVSAEIRAVALRRGDSALNQESGFPALLDLIGQKVLDPSRTTAASRALSEARFVVSQLLASLSAEEAGIADQKSVDETLQRLEQEQERLERLRSGSARWQLVLNDRFADMLADAEHSFRQRVRQAGRDADETLENTDPANTWDGVAADIRDRMAEAVSRLIRDLEAGTDETAAAIIELLREDDLRLDPVLGRATPDDIARFWSGAGPGSTSFGEAAASTWAAMRGAQGGILVFGMLGGLAGLALTTTMLVGIGAVFGGKGLLDERKKQVTQRRQKARNAVRQFLDDVQFETSKSMRDLTRNLQRQLRDHFSERIGESIRTCATAAESLEASLRQTRSAREARLAVLRKDLQSLKSVDARIGALQAGSS